MTTHEKFESFIRKMDESFSKIDKLEDPTVKVITKKFTKRARLLTKFNFSLGVIVSGFFSVYPYFAGRSLPYGLWIPGVDVLSSPVYEIVYIVEVC